MLNNMYHNNSTRLAPPLVHLSNPAQFSSASQTPQTRLDPQLGLGGGVYLPQGGHHGPHGFGHDSSLDEQQQQQQQHHHPPLDGSHRLVAPPGMSVAGGLDSQYRGPGGPAGGMGGGPGGGHSRLGAGVGGPGRDGPGRDGPPSSLGRSGNGASAVSGGGGGTGTVDIPDAIPAELSYEVRYEADAGADRDRDRGRRGAGGLAVELAKSQDLRVRAWARDVSCVFFCGKTRTLTKSTRTGIPLV